jgi:hypothetical protein
MTTIRSMGFEHDWLSEEFVAESQRQAENEKAWRHHYVPQMYLRRWTVDGKVQPTDVDTGRVYPPNLPRDVAYERNFYSLPQGESPLDLPLKWIETHLSRIENTSARRLRTLEDWGAGVMSDDEVKRDLSVFLGLQGTRTVSNRERTLAVINGPDSAKREYLKQSGLSGEDIEESMRKRQANPQHEALDLMINDVRNVAATGLYAREWAVYRTAKPIVTCDDPVVLLAGPPFTRDRNAGVGLSAAALYPLNPNQVLVMLRPGLHHRGSYLLDDAETHSVNVEIVAAAAKTTFERPGDGIAVKIRVPPWPVRAVIDEDVIANLSAAAALKKFLASVVPGTRWTDLGAAPDWPVPRWYGN